MFSRLSATHRDEGGLALIVVMGVAGVLLVLATTIAMRSINDARQVGKERRSQQAVHIADAAVDDTLFRLAGNHDYNTGVALPSFASPAEERQWAIDQAAVRTPTVMTEGDWVAIKPVGVSVIYAVGYVPSKATADKIRVVRAEYDFAPPPGDQAILTDGNLAMTGDGHLHGSHGSAHANGNVVASGNITTSGYLSASGTFTSESGSVILGDPEHSGGGRPLLDVPDVSPRNFYELSEYDLCPGGVVRPGPKFSGTANTTGIPCNDSLPDLAGGTETFRGWSYKGHDGSRGHKWVSTGGDAAAYSGSYYVYQGSATVSGGAGGVLWEATVIAEQETVGCPGTGGDISFSGGKSIRYHPKAQPVALIAGRDLTLSGNTSSGAPDVQGIIGARNTVVLNGGKTLYGMIITNDICGANLEISGGSTVTYNGEYELPLGNIPRVTLWLEL